MSKTKTPSFILELPLKKGDKDESVLLTRFEAARQLYNACLGEAKKRLNLLRQSKAFHSARSLPKGKERVEAFRSLNIQFGFREFDLHSFASKIRQSWIGNHIDSLTAQKIATRAFNAVQRVAFGKARNVRFKGKNQLDSVEGKTNASGIRYKDGFVYWNGLKLQCIINPKDEVHVYGLSHPVKYCRLIKRKLNKRIRFYVQLILEGYPFQKYDFPQNIVGLDIGPSTIAHVSEKHANLETFCNQLENKQNTPQLAGYLQ